MQNSKELSSFFMKSTGAPHKKRGKPNGPRFQQILFLLFY